MNKKDAEDGIEYEVLVPDFTIDDCYDPYPELLEYWRKYSTSQKIMRYQQNTVKRINESKESTGNYNNEAVQYELLTDEFNRATEQFKQDQTLFF